MSENSSQNFTDVPKHCPVTPPPPKLIASPSKVHDTFASTSSTACTSLFRLSTLPKLLQSPQVVLTKMDNSDTTPVKKIKRSSISPDIAMPLPPPPPLVKMPTRKGKRAAVTRADTKATKPESSVEGDKTDTSPSQQEPPRKRTRRDNSEMEGRAPSRKIIQEIFGPDKSKRPKGKGRKRRKGPPTPKKKQTAQQKLVKVEYKDAEVEEEVEPLVDDQDTPYQEPDNEEECVDVLESNSEDPVVVFDNETQSEINDDQFSEEIVEDEAIDTGEIQEEETVEHEPETDDAHAESGEDHVDTVEDGDECLDAETCENVEQEEPYSEDDINEKNVELEILPDKDFNEYVEEEVEPVSFATDDAANVSEEELALLQSDNESDTFNPEEINDEEDEPELVEAFSRGRRAAKQVANEKLKQNLETEQEPLPDPHESDECESANEEETGPGLILRRRSTSATDDSVKSYTSVNRPDSAYSEDITNLPIIDRYRNYTPSYSSEEEEEDAKNVDEEQETPQDQKDSDVDSINSWKPVQPVAVESLPNNYPPPGTVTSIELDSKTVAAAERRARKIYRYKGRSRRSLLFKSSSSKKFTTSANSNRYSGQTTVLPKVFHHGYFFQPGDVIYVDSTEDTPFYGHIRGLLLDPFGEISAGIRWLFPKCGEYVDADFHPLNYTYRKDVPENLIKISHVNFVMHLSLDAFDGHYSFNKKERNAFYTRVGKQIYDYCLSSSSDEDSDDVSSENSQENDIKEPVPETGNEESNGNEGENDEENSAPITEVDADLTDSTDVGDESESGSENVPGEADAQETENFDQEEIEMPLDEEETGENSKECLTPEAHDSDQDKMETEDTISKEDDETNTAT